MWQYEKKLQYPINIKNPNPKYAQIIISQYGGPDGELEIHFCRTFLDWNKDVICLFSSTHILCFNTMNLTYSVVGSYNIIADFKHNFTSKKTDHV